MQRRITVAEMDALLAEVAPELAAIRVAMQELKAVLPDLKPFYRSRPNLKRAGTYYHGRGWTGEHTIVFDHRGEAYQVPGKLQLPSPFRYFSLL